MTKRSPPISGLSRVFIERELAYPPLAAPRARPEVGPYLVCAKRLFWDKLYLRFFDSGLAQHLDERQLRWMRIAVLSDTHDRYPPSLPERLRGADEIWHLGDVCDPSTLTEFEELGPPLRVVMGNCDSYHGWPLALELEREGVRFYLTHIPPSRAPKGCQAVLHGHTHVPRDEMVRGVRWLNPGCITRPNRGALPSFAWLTVEKGKLVSWELAKL